MINFWNNNWNYGISLKENFPSPSSIAHHNEARVRECLEVSTGGVYWSKLDLQNLNHQ